MAVGLTFDLAKVGLLFVAVVIAKTFFEDARDGYAFLFHDTHDEIIKLLTGATPATTTPTDSAAMEALYNDTILALLCHGRLQFQVAVAGPSRNGSPVSVTSSTPPSVIGHRTLPAINCSFEQGLCGWTQGQTDDLDWTVGRGSTPTTDTGPDADHTLNSVQGHYLYLEATGTAPQEGAELLSPSFTLTSDLCVSIWFSMYGEDVDRLEIVTRDTAGNEDVLWSRSGNQGQGWNKVEVTLTHSSSEKQLVIRAQTGSSVLSDIGVDDVQVVSGFCPGFVTQECISQPCVNGGSCTQEVYYYVCSCLPGYTGANCQTDQDDCISAPCLHGVTCHDGVNNFTCTCPLGYHGAHCEINLDDCMGAPCLHGGTCHDGVDSFTCTCTPGFNGFRCSHNHNDCRSTPCQNGGTCHDRVNNFTCTCPLGYHGARCEINPDDCISAPCLHGGTCHDGVNNFTCTCPLGYLGDRCDITCPRDQFDCGGHLCIPSSYHCDSYCNCYDGCADEEHCRYG